MSIIAAVAFRSTLSGWSFVSRRRHRRHRRVGDRAVGARGDACCSARASPCRRSAFVVLGGIAVGGLPTPGAYGRLRPRPRRRLGRPAVERPAGRHHRAAAGAAVHRRLAGGGHRRRDRPRLATTRAAGDRADPRPRPQPAVHDRGALAGARPGRRDPRRHAAADHGRAAPGPPPRSPRSTSSTPAARRHQPHPPDARRRGRRRRRRRRPARRSAPPGRRVQRALRPAPLPGAPVRPAGRAEPAGRGQGVAEGRPQGRRRVHGLRRHAGHPLPARRAHRLRRRHLDRRRPRSATPAAPSSCPSTPQLPDLDDPLPDGLDDRRRHDRDQGPRRQLPAHRRHRPPPRPADRRRRRARSRG